jgi:phosphatidate cytidylyltransferase
MLKQRIITGVILAASLLAAVLTLPLAPLAMLLGAVVAIAAWEWSALAGFHAVWARLLYAAVGCLGMFALYHYCQLGAAPVLEHVQPFLGLACLWWAIALLWVKGFPASAALWGGRPMLSLMGMLVLLPPWLSVVYLLTYEDGRLLLLAMIIVVAAADIGAYFSGRRWGRRKLAVEVSPGKSWEGFWGGLAACILLAIIAAYGFQPPQLSAVALLAIVVFTALASVLGDLVESMVKRHRGVKDSGVLLPGHGGFCDRIDGITAAAPVFGLGLILAGWLP